MFNHAFSLAFSVQSQTQRPLPDNSTESTSALVTGCQSAILADTVTSQLSQYAVSRKDPLFSGLRFRRVWAIAASDQQLQLVCCPHSRPSCLSVDAAHHSSLAIHSDGYQTDETDTTPYHLVFAKPNELASAASLMEDWRDTQYGWAKVFPSAKN